MAKKSGMKILIGVGAVAAAAGIGYYFYNKSKSDGVAGLGLLDVSSMGAVKKVAYKWRFMTDGEFGTKEGNMHNWHEVHPHAGLVLPRTPMPILMYGRGDKTGHFYAIADDYVYLLLHKVGGVWRAVQE